MFLLDTVVLSELRKPDRNPGVAAWIAEQRDADLFLSVVSLGEIERGVALVRVRDSAFADRLALWLAQLVDLHGQRILPVSAAIALRWGRLSAALGHHGADLLLAATALEHGLAVVTRNERHFTPARVPVVNPWS